MTEEPMPQKQVEVPIVLGGEDDGDFYLLLWHRFLRHLAVLHMLDADGYQLFDMFVVGAVVDLAALATEADQPRGAQDAQVVRNRRGTHVDGLGEVIDAELLALDQRPQQQDPTRIAKNLEKLGHGRRLFAVCGCRRLEQRLVGVGEGAFAGWHPILLDNWGGNSTSSEFARSTSAFLGHMNRYADVKRIWRCLLYTSPSPR